MVKVLKCNICGAILEVAKDGHNITCCGEAMKELKANTEDAAQEKHVPEVEVNGNTVTVKVGSVEHPMLPEHHIAHIWLETTGGVQRKDLNPEEKPEAVFALADGVSPVAAYEYCNLHGFWKKEL
ncbi:MAG: desulfoferrodoxin [Firmicutes bacterium]|nr:desulfoferrodoxin [Bacillota bacterium]